MLLPNMPFYIKIILSERHLENKQQVQKRCSDPSFLIPESKKWNPHMENLLLNQEVNNIDIIKEVVDQWNLY